MIRESCLAPISRFDLAARFGVNKAHSRLDF
jgi:hypothetical protein